MTAGDREDEQGAPQELSDDEVADVEVFTGVRAEKLRFGAVPETKVWFEGEPAERSSKKTERENLPEEVEPERHLPRRQGALAGPLADSPPERSERFVVNTKATAEAIRARLQGESGIQIPGGWRWPRTAGTGIAVVVYRSLRD